MATGIKLYGGVALLWTSTVQANPVGEQVIGGAATFERVGNSLTIQQGTDRAVINWNQFSIAAGETTKFVMPSSSSAALNRVLSGNPSAIYGNLQANGHLFLINPAGIMVGPGGTINAASFLASTHDIDPAAFMKGGDLNLLGHSAASILNQGKIEASSGDVFLIAQHVENEGQIMARDGTVGMVSGTQVTLQSVGPHGFKVRLLDVPDEQAKVKTKEGVADIVNEGVIEAANVMLESTGNIGSLAINNTGTIRATGIQANADGSVSLIGGQGDVVNAGVVAALRKNLEGRETGGDIQIAGRNITTEESSLVSAAGAAGGGSIRMRGQDTTLVSGRVEATGYGDLAKGGRVELLGKNVGLRSGEVNADGGAKGGTVLAGGDYLGLNPEIPNAKATVITPDARISANATVNGDGGKVIVWSDEYTGFFGGITALGGPEGGNGGFIETSSKNNLQAFGEAQASAAKGIPGEWLLDPYNVTITSQAPSSGGGFNGQNPDLFTPTANNANIFNGDINRALDAGTSVTITTGPATTVPTPPGVGEPAGNITVAANLTKSKDTPPDSPDVVLRLQAANDIIVNGGITIRSTAGSMGIELLADYDNSGTGRVDLRDNVTLASNSGNIILQSAPGLTVGVDVSIDATLSLATSNALWGGQRFSGDVTIRPSITATPTSVGVGGGAGSLQITQGIVDAITLLDPSLATTARAGTLYLGSRSSGRMTVGTLDGPNGLSANLQLVAGFSLAGLVQQGILQDLTGLGVGAGAGMVVLDTSGNLGAAGEPVRVRASQLGILTEGRSLNVVSDQDLTRLYVQTAGTSATQAIGDGGNLNYDVAEVGLETTIGGVSGFFVNSGSIDFTYINTGGGITVGAAGRMATPTGWTGGIPFGILATQDPNANGGQGPATTPGKVTLKAAGALTMTAGVAPTPIVNPNAFSIVANSGGIFTGGGDLTIEATDFASSGTIPFYYFYDRNGDPPPPTGYRGQLLGPQTGPALNTFAPVADGAGGIGVWDFGLRQPVNAGIVLSGQISGQGGVLSLSPSANIYGPGGITISDGTLANIFSISNPETWTMEANVIQIGGSSTGQVDLLRHDVNFGTSITVYSRDIGVTTTYFYTIRYFENPFYGYGLDGTRDRAVPSTGDQPVPRVANGLVHLVSGTSTIELERGGDVNVSTLGATAIGGVNLRGNNNGETGNYAGSGTANRILFYGSIINNLTGRLGRTVLDTQVSQGNAFNATFAVGGFGTGGLLLGDSTDAARGVAIMGSDGSGTLRVEEIQLDQASFFVGGNAVGLGAFTGTAEVLIGPPDLPSGTQARATATVVAGRVTAINVDQDNQGSGYLQAPAVTVLMPKTPGTATGVGGQQASGRATIVGGRVTGVTPVTADGASIFGGSRYQSVPEVTLTGGGISLGAARAVRNEFGQIGVIAAVQPGLGYSSAPTVTISGGGGTGAVAQAVVNDRGELTPYTVTFGGRGYQTTPTVVITDPTGTGAVARPIMAGLPGDLTVVGIMPVSGGSNYSNPTIQILGGNPTQTASATAKNGLSVLDSFQILNPGAGYTSDPTVTLSGGGIEIAQARAFVDANPLSGNFGRVTAYQLANPGSGYRQAPSVIVGTGGPTGQSGEVGISSDAVDSSLLSGSIVVVNSRFGAGQENLEADELPRSLYLNAPIMTGDAYGSSGNPSASGSVLLQSSGSLTANTRRANFSYGFRGLLQTGDASTTFGGGNLAASPTSSGDIRILAQRVSSATSALLDDLNISQGLPVQIGRAGTSGGLQVITFGSRRIGGEEGALRIYAPAPGQMEALIGQPLNPNLAVSPRPRVSNDLKVYGLTTDETILNQVRVEVGAAEGLLTLEAFEESGAVAQLTDGSVTFIQPALDGRLYLSAPTVVIGGGGVVPATATAEVTSGAVTGLVVGDPGQGYSVAPTITITGGGGQGAEAEAVLVNGRVASIRITNPGFGYTSNPIVTISGPAGVQAQAALGGLTSTGGINSLLNLTLGAGYVTAPTVRISDPTGTGASVRAVVNAQGQISPFTMVSGGSGYLAAPQVTITGGGGTGATARAVIQNGVVVGIIPENGGSGYTGTVTVTIAPPPAGAPAIATATVPTGGSLVSFLIDNPGAGYSNPTITLGLPQIQATARVNLVDQQIASYTITNAGGGYTASPTVFLQPAGPNPFFLDIDEVGFFSDRFSVFAAGRGNEQVTAAVVGVGPFTNQRPVNLGTSSPGETSFVEADLQRFVADALVVGTRRYLDPAFGAGVITVSQALNVNSINLQALVLAGTREIRDLGGTTGIDFSNLAIDAGGAVSFTGFQNRADYLAGVIRDSGLAAGATFRFDAALRGSSLTGFKPLTLSQVVVGAPQFTGQDFYQGIETQDGDITLHADDIELGRLVGFLDTTGGGTIGTSTATVTLAPLSPGGSRPVNINYEALSRPNGKAADNAFFGLTSIQVQTPGSGYKSVPVVTIAAPTAGTTATGTAQMVLGAIDTAGGIGSGYTSIPTVTITGGGAQRQATGQAVVDFDPTSTTFGKVIAVRITDQGIGYQWTDGSTVPTGQSPLTITFSGGGGTTATTTGSLAVRSIQVSGGAGYAEAPAVTIAAPTSAAGTTATAAGLLGALSFRIGNPSQPELEKIRAASVVIGANSRGDSYVSSAANVSLNSNFGFDYGTYSFAPRTAVFAGDGTVALGLSQVPPSPFPQPATSSIQVPNFSVIAGGAVNLGPYGQATANAAINAPGGGLSTISVDYAGEGYTQAPVVTLTSADGNGTGATATATINSAGQVTGFTITNVGSGYTTAPLVSLTGPIVTAAAAPIMGVGTVAITDGGTGYTVAPAVTFSPPPAGGRIATGTANISNGRVTSVTITDPGSGYTSQPAVSFASGGAVGTAYLSIQNFSVADVGTGYAEAPIVGITSQPGNPGYGASASAVLNTKGQITPYLVVSGGSGYTTAPAVTIFGVGGAGATARAVVQDGVVVGIIPENGGSGYTGAVTVNIAPPPAGTPATATATVPGGGSLVSFILNRPGSFYSQAPNLGLTGTPTAPQHTVDFISAEMTGAGNSFRFSRDIGTLTVADLAPLGGATGITTSAGGGVFLTAPILEIPMMAPQLVDPRNTDPYIRDGIGLSVVNPTWNPFYVTPSAINSGGSVYLRSSDNAGRISVAVVPDFDENAWNSPQPTGSVVNPVIQAGSANSAVVLTANRIEIADNGSNNEPGLLYPALIAANTSSGRVVLQPRSANTDILLGGTKGADFNFTGTELRNIQANVLQVGNSTAGDISVETLIRLDTNRLPGAFSLIGGGTIRDDIIGIGNGIVYGGGLRLSGNGAIIFESTANRFGTVAANSTRHDITLTSTGFFIGPVDTLTGITAVGSRVKLQPSSSVPINLGTKTLTAPAVLYGGTGYTTAPTMTIAAPPTPGGQATGTVNVAGGVITGTALTSAGSGYTSNPLVTLSGGGGSNGSVYATSDFSFTDAMLDLVTADTLQIGRNDGVLASGDITISAAISLLPAKVNTLSLWTGAGVADNGGSTGIQVNQLAIRAGTSASSSSVSLNGAGNKVGDLAGELINPAAPPSSPDRFFSFTDNDATSSLPLNITTVDGLLGINTLEGNGAVTLTADDMNILDEIKAGTGVITLQPLTLSTNISLNDPSNSLSLTEAELQLLSTSTTVVIGNTAGTGAINLGGNGNINLSGNLSYAYSLTLRGAASPLIFNGGLTLANNTTLTLNLGAGTVTSPFTGTDVTIGGGAGTLAILSAGSVGAAGVPLTTALGVLAGATVTPGGLYLSNAGALSISGAMNVAGDIDITTQSGDLTVSQNVNSANLNLTSAGNLSLSQAVNATGNATLTASSGSVNVSSSLNSGGNVNLTAGGGALTLGSTVSAANNLTGSAAGNITINDAVTSGGIVSFSSTQAGTSINVGAGGSITSSLANGLTGTPTIQLTADDLILNGTLQSANSSGGILLQPLSVAKPIEVFGAAATLAGAFFIGDAVFKDQLLGTAPVTIGRSNGTGEVRVNSSANAYKTGRNQLDRNLAIQSGNLASGQSFNVVGSIKSAGNDIIFKAGQGDFTASAFIDASINNDGSENLTSGSISVFAGTINLTQTPTLRANGAINFGFIGGDTYVNVPGLHPGALSINFVPNAIQTRGYLTFGSPAGGSSVFLGSIDLSTVGGLGLFAGETGQIQLQNNLSGGNIYIDGPLVLSQPLQTTINSSGSVFVINGIQSASTQTLRVLSVGDFTFASNVNPANLAGTLNLDGISGSILLGMTSASVPQALQGVYVGSSVSLPTRGLDQRFASTFTLPKAAALQGGAISMTGVNGANLNLAAGALSGSQNLFLTTTGGGNITTASLQTSSLTLNSSTSANIGGAIATTGATSLTTGTTLATQAITASTLNVSAATSATLNGAVNTSAGGGISISTPTLTTGSTLNAALGNILLAVNSMNLAGTATAQAGNVTLTPFTAGNNLNLGSMIPAASMLQLQAPNGNVTFQTTGAGQILLAGPINLSSSGTDNYNLVTAGGNVVFSGASPVLTLPANGLLTLDLGSGNVISSGGTDYAASQGQLVILSAGNVTMGTDIPTFGRPGVVTAPASLTLRNAGSLSLIGPIDTGTGNVSIRTLSGNLTLASTVAGGTIQLGAAQNFNNQAGPTPFTNRNGGRTFVYSYGQGYDNPYNFAGLQGFGVAFGRGFGSTIGSGNMLVYSAYAQVALDYGVVYNEMFAGNSVSALLAMDSTLFLGINGLGIPKAKPGGYIDYMLYPQRVEPAGSSLPAPSLSRLERELGRPPTVEELAADTIRVRQSRLMRTGAVLERSSFDERPAEPVENIPQDQAEWQSEGEIPVDGQIPQAQAPLEEPIPTAQSPQPILRADQANKHPVSPPSQTGPNLRRGTGRAVALRIQSLEGDTRLQAAKILEEERMRAEFGVAKPVAGQIK